MEKLSGALLILAASNLAAAEVLAISLRNEHGLRAESVPGFLVAATAIAGIYYLRQLPAIGRD